MRQRLDAGRSGRERPGPAWAVRILVSPASAAVALALVGLVFAVFRAWPALDLGTAALFYTGETRFLPYAAAGGVLRQTLSLIPWVVMAAMAAATLARRIGGVRTWAPGWRGLVFLTVSAALGPGLLVNGILKDQVHRPRPAQVVEFGGAARFKPVGSLAGECPRNCAFVSGEVAFEAWMVAAVLLAPAPLQPVGLAAALALTTASALSRMSFGAHFLSDTLLAALFTWLVVIAVWWAVFGVPEIPRAARIADPARAAS